MNSVSRTSLPSATVVPSKKTLANKRKKEKARAKKLEAAASSNPSDTVDNKESTDLNNWTLEDAVFAAKQTLAVGFIVVGVLGIYQILRK